jgi:hypothetical protein
MYSRRQRPAAATPVLAAVGLVAAFTATLPAQPVQPAPTVPVRSPGTRADDAIHRPREFRADLIGWMALGRVVWSSGYDQVVGSPGTWPRDAESYGRRFATRTGQLVAIEATRHGLAAALGRDPQYVRCACDGAWPRLGHVTLGALTDFDRDGVRRVGWPRLAGALAGAFALGRLQPGQGAGETVAWRTLTSLGGTWLGNFTKEFGLLPGQKPVGSQPTAPTAPARD